MWFVLGDIFYPVNIIPEGTNYLYYSEYDIELIESYIRSWVIDDSSLHQDGIFSTSLSIIVFYNFVAPVGSIALVISLMFRWTTQYNLKKFWI